MILRLFSTILIFFTLMFGLFVDSKSQAIKNPEGGITRVSADDMMPKTMTGSQFTEFWNFQFYFDNGMKAHVIFSIANMSRMYVSGVRVSIFGLDNKNVYQISREYPLENLLLDHEGYMFELNPRQQNIWFGGSMEEGIKMYINTAKDGERFNVELEITDIVLGATLGNGKFTAQNETIGIQTLIPYAKVSGRVGINENIKDVKGTAYLDHTYQNQTTTDLMHSGYRFVNHRDSQNWNVIYFMRPKSQAGKQTIGYQLSSINGKMESSGVVGIINETEGKAFRNNVPQSLSVYLENGNTISINRIRDEEVHSILGGLSWVARQAARAFLGGDVKDFRGTATFEETGKAKVQGEYNYFFVD